jgi:hypothetical protein
MGDVAVLASGMSLPIAGLCGTGLVTDSREQLHVLLLTLQYMGLEGIPCTEEDHKMVLSVIANFQADWGR